MLSCNKPNKVFHLLLNFCVSWKSFILNSMKTQKMHSQQPPPLAPPPPFPSKNWLESQCALEPFLMKVCSLCWQLSLLLHISGFTHIWLQRPPWGGSCSALRGYREVKLDTGGMWKPCQPWELCRRESSHLAEEPGCQSTLSENAGMISWLLFKVHVFLKEKNVGPSWPIYTSNEI